MITFQYMAKIEISRNGLDEYQNKRLDDILKRVDLPYEGAEIALASPNYEVLAMLDDSEIFEKLKQKYVFLDSFNGTMIRYLNCGAIYAGHIFNSLDPDSIKSSLPSSSRAFQYLKSIEDISLILMTNDYARSFKKGLKFTLTELGLIHIWDRGELDFINEIMKYRRSLSVEDTDSTLD